MGSKQKNLVTVGHSLCALDVTGSTFHSSTGNNVKASVQHGRTLPLSSTSSSNYRFSTLMMLHIVCYHSTLYIVLDSNCLQGHLRSAEVHTQDTQAPRTARFWQHSCSRQQKMMLPTRLELWCWWSLIEVACPAQTPTGRIQTPLTNCSQAPRGLGPIQSTGSPVTLTVISSPMKAHYQAACRPRRVFAQDRGRHPLGTPLASGSTTGLSVWT